MVQVTLDLQLSVLLQLTEYRALVGDPSDNIPGTEPT
jgi:5'-3' exonuclease